MQVEICFNSDQTRSFIILYFPAISLWLNHYKYEVKTESIKEFEWFEDPMDSYFQGISGEIIVKGRRYLFKDESAAIHFKLRWGLSLIDDTDEWVQRYLKILREGCNQLTNL